MRIDDPQQRLGDLRKLVVDLEVHPGGKKGECFEQPLDMRIFAFGGLDDQPRSYLGIFFGELDSALPQVGQLALVVEQQVIPHRTHSVGRTHWSAADAVGL